MTGMTMIKMLAVQKVARVTPVNSLKPNKHEPFDINAPMPAKQLRKLQRECKRANPAFFRALRRASDKQLQEVEYQMRDQDLMRLRRLRPTFEVEREIADHQYSLRLLDELKYWQNNKPRKQIPRRKPKSEQTPTIDSVPRPEPTVAPTPWPAPMPIPEEFKLVALKPKPKPEPENLDNFRSKFFHNSNGDNSVW
jgi:hypothetical protein